MCIRDRFSRGPAHIHASTSPQSLWNFKNRKPGQLVPKDIGKEWGAILVIRETPGVSTFKEAGKALEEKKMLCIAPEGTRSGNGVLAKGQQGVVFLALKNRVPILIVAHYGAENFWHNIKRLK